MSKGRSLNDVIIELERQNNAKQDYIAPGRAMRMDTDGKTFAITNNNTGENLTFDSSKILHRQIGGALNIPAKYYDLMGEKKPELLAHNINTWFRDSENDYMLRSFQYPDQSIGRALLSSHYRRIDNLLISDTVLPFFAGTSDYEVISCEVTERKLYFKIVNRRLEGNVSVGDTVQAGVIVSNSEVGMGAVSVQPFIYRLVCGNGMVVEEKDMTTRRAHLGRQLESTDTNYAIYTDETMQAEDKAFALRLRDFVKNAMDEQMFKRNVKKLENSRRQTIYGDPQEVIKNISKAYDINSKEQVGISRYLVEGGELSRYGLANAITRMSKDVPDYDRSTELEGIGWNVASMESNLWDQMNSKEYTWA